MNDSTSVPILLDADTSYGNFNNARRLVQKLEKIGIGGCCMQDRIFPMSNSFLEGCQQSPLADMEKFALKFKACKDIQEDPDFVIVGRVEGFSLGYGLDEVLKRAEKYRNAGADAVLIHSSKGDPSEIEYFMKVWKNRGPVMIVPSKLVTTPAHVLQEMGVSVVIWAHHTLKASVKAMQEVTGQIFRDQCLVNVDPQVASVKEIFRLQRDDELANAEAKYLPKL